MDDARGRPVDSQHGNLEELPGNIADPVERMRTVAHLLDDSVPIPGTNYRVGLDPILGVIPGAGDTVTAGLSLYIVFEAARLGVPTATLMRMLANIAIDTFVGSIPVVGDLFDASFKANRRNVDLVMNALDAE